jgi:hypothetical protein
MLVRPEETSSSLRVRHDAYVKNGRVLIGVADRIEKDATVVHVNKENVSYDQFLPILTLPVLIGVLFNRFHSTTLLLRREAPINPNSNHLTFPHFIECLTSALNTTT